ncbi:sugar (glycoside-pentoside-hexuronide) transporter [Lachnospiraceae bacterium PF1-21]|uniref:Glycoside-pentoside-hexuronide (GPH):cation symporter n=1 Tax=Ohessyouella blattaphilus TaxID=2949333 RepID=A0ABT1EG00_9FIRM|nr:glycoside-pentoside-hexuronide (GPH):cation symporter [Ohessyouella blattaphilus]MCP1109627.1 glycoside-pentoside-hexuronide (GPH):cation symporter [Ohessyouella blattaphilus]MCR8563021.1 glycoside-pentoside-hexuronide (GPH):cation symporter [Ohessyouella blattaphilus]MDL2250856.1 glycoside-pentoside-hexuronide (GPH):cation symporter [Lachnospiraceae bacterium OttesenSCG-928-J05]
MEKKDMNGLQIIGYGLGSLGKDFALGVMGSYLLLFYTDVFGISAAAAGMIFLLTKIWDAINDPMMGAIADRSPVTRFGRYRPYVLLAALPLSVFCVLCFLAPDLSPTGKVAYAAITYTITGMIFTAYDVPLWSMVPSLSSNQNTKNKLIGVARTFTTLALFLSSAVAYNAVIKLGGGTEPANLKAGFPKFMVIVGIISVVFAVITFISTKEVNIQEAEVETNLFKNFKRVMCKPLIAVLLSMVCCAFGMILPATVGTYYMIYYLGRPDLIALYMAISMGLGMITSILAPALMKKVTSKQLSFVGFGMNIVAGVVVFMAGKNSIPVVFVCFAIVGLATGLLMVSITTMLAETAAHISGTKGIRADGVCFSMNSFAIKVGQALASAAVSFLLAATGYVANAQQTQEALTGILLSRSLIPAGVAILGVICVAMWKLGEE